ncbi:MAG: 23S rRNA (pseudouridine(1915)-N(3))-methyltransferase RlmH [Desulfobulbaceae bacterium]
MKFVFFFLGRTTEKYLEEGINDYAARLGRFVQVEIVVLREKAAKSLPPEQFRLQEARQLLERCTEASWVVALDDSGRELDSPSLAEQLSRWEEAGLRRVHFLIGGHLGLHGDVLQRADLVLSLSRLTFTHEMARLILLEQLYRGWMIKVGRSYHN